MADPSSGGSVPKVMPSVWSVSYSSAEVYEQALTQSFQNLQNVLNRSESEFQKMGAMGYTLAFAAGDNGVSGSSTGNSRPGITGTAGSNSSCGFYPRWPCTSPHVTCVGGTMFQNPASASASASAPPEEVVSVGPAAYSQFPLAAAFPTQITGGGGFSNLYDRKATARYQDDAVSAYVAKHTANVADQMSPNTPVPELRYSPPTYKPGYTTSSGTGWNPSGRGVPDVSAMAANYLVSIGGDFQQVSPVF